MDAPILVVSNPPHGDVNLEAVAELLGLDIYATGLKAKFRAPEVLSASNEAEATEFAAAARAAGLNVSVLSGSALAEPPWPAPVSSLVFDQSGLQAVTLDRKVTIPVDAQVVGVYCQPPGDFEMKPPIDPNQAVTSGHGPTIAEAIQWMSNLDLYFQQEGSLSRVSIVPDLAEVDAPWVITQLKNRFTHLRMDTRLANVRPRSRFIMGEAGFDPDQRKRYSFGTLLLCHVLESVAVELRDVPQYEFGSRMAYALVAHGGGSD